ncbi:MAG: LysM peptidoglycan-binding domain-containing protein [Gallionella sp.]|nr:LysM peptidoglycan-binding domain-containing protein [Gallionella sp.]MDD4959304.1 LysM peptidoglycan-binding domain-containing protein [Gallionella sp.]
MRKIISLICFLLPAIASAAQPEFRPDAPDQHVVVKGDTLWGISNLFFKDPWKWPQLWDVNQNDIKDPHWIYPGNVIRFDRNAGKLQIATVSGEVKMADGTVKLSPKARMESNDPIFSIPSRALNPFLAQPLAVEENDLETAPMIVALQEQRVVLGEGELGYASGLTADNGIKWQAYQPSKPLVDPETEEVLGHEVTYLGDVKVVKFADPSKIDEPSTVRVTKSRQEIERGARLVPFKEELTSHYLPRAPEGMIESKVISIYGSSTQASQNSIITLNKGARDGLKVGHVLALYKAGKTVQYQGKDVNLPDERNGLLFVFRVFNKVAYALVMETRLPVTLLDRAQTP